MTPTDRSLAMRLLARELRAEVGKVEDTVAECARARERLRDRPPDRLELTGVGGLLHGFYNGVERALSRIAPETNGGLPAGREWHRRLVEQMSLEIPGVRPAVLRRETVVALEDYLGFRHRFRHLYFFDLRWERLRDLLERLDGVWALADADLRLFADFLDQLGEEPEQTTSPITEGGAGPR